MKYHRDLSSIRQRSDSHTCLLLDRSNSTTASCVWVGGCNTFTGVLRSLLAVRIGFTQAFILTTCLVFTLMPGSGGAQSNYSDARPAIEALRDRDYAKALALSKRLTREYPDDPRAWTLEGMALANLRRTGEALKALHQALNRDPDYVAALKATAQLDYDAGYPEAQGLLEKLLRMDPTDQTAHAMLGALAYKQRDCNATIAHFDRSRDAISDMPTALAEFGACLLRVRRPGDAIPVLRRLEQLQPDDWHSRYYLGLAQFLAHQYADAIQTIKPLTEGASLNTEALNLVAQVYEANRQTPQAVAALQSAIRFNPHEVNNYLDLAALCLDHGAFQVGVDVLTASLKTVPDSAPVHIERGALYVQMGRFEEADADFEKATTLEPGQNFSTVARGISLVQKNNLGQALETVQIRLKQAPRDPVLNYLLAEILIRQGVLPGTHEFQEATDAAQRAVRSKPDFALAYDVLSVVYLRSGQTSEAAAASRLALKTDPNDSAAVYHLIVCLRKQGEKRELPQLVKKLAAMTALERERTAALNRYKLVEEEAGLTSSTRPH